MRAISLWQPWATAIAVKVKRIETRHWSTDYRGPLVIHAAKVFDSSQRQFHALEIVRGRLPSQLPFGALIAVANLVDVRRSEALVDSISEVEKLYGNYSPRRYGWILEDVRPLPAPIAYRGAQGFFNVPDELIPCP